MKRIIALFMLLLVGTAQAWPTLMGIFAGSNIVLSGSASSPTIAVTAAPSFTKITTGQSCVGTVCATGIGANDLSVANGAAGKIWIGSAGTNFLNLSGSTLQVGGGTLSMLSGNSVTSGNTTLSGTTVSSAGNVIAGNASAAACTAGDVCVARSTSTGALQFGGSVKNCIVDYNITLASYVTNPCGNGQITTSSGNANFAVNNTGTGNTQMTLSAITGSITATLQATTSTTPAPGPNTYGIIKFIDTAYPGKGPSIGGGITDSGDGSTHGGYLLLNATTYGASPTTVEAVQVTPGGHVGFPAADVQASIASAATCTALTSCGTYTWTFANPYITNAGAAQNPICLSPSIEDSTTPTAVWVGNVVAGSESSTSVQFNYAPLLATVAPHSLTLTMSCRQGIF